MKRRRRKRRRRRRRRRGKRRRKKRKKEEEIEKEARSEKPKVNHLLFKTRKQEIPKDNTNQRLGGGGGREGGVREAVGR